MASLKEGIEKHYLDYMERHSKLVYSTAVLKEWHVSLWNATGIKLPYQTDATHLYITEYEDTENYDDDRVVNVKATNAIFRKIVKFARSKGYPVEKNYYDDSFDITVTLEEADKKYQRIRVVYSADRNVVCNKRVVGTKVIPARTEEVFEWECAKVSYLDSKGEDK